MAILIFPDQEGRGVCLYVYQNFQQNKLSVYNEIAFSESVWSAIKLAN